MSQENLYPEHANWHIKLVDDMERYAHDRSFSTRNNTLFQAKNEPMVPTAEPSTVLTSAEVDLRYLNTEELTRLSIIAEQMSQASGNPDDYYRNFSDIAQSMVATISNDLVAIGARPSEIKALWGVGDIDWFINKPRWQGIVDGWTYACNAQEAVYTNGEAPRYNDMILPNAVILSGMGTGPIPEGRLTVGEHLREGDHIIMVESSGINTRGVGIAQQLATEYLPNGYNTVLPSGKTFGEKILNPAHLYTKIQRELFFYNIPIHNMKNISTHGWKNLMQPRRPFTYRIHTLPDIPEECALIQQTGSLSDEHMYADFNMGGGFAFIVRPEDAHNVRQIIMEFNLHADDVGVVESGPQQVIIEPKNLVYTSKK